MTGRRGPRLWIAAVGLLLSAHAGAQEHPTASIASANPDAASTRSNLEAFGIEAAGGSAGSLLGFGILYLGFRSCGVEDLGCNLRHAFAGIAAGTALSAAGTWAAGRSFDTDPSAIGAAAGAVVGAAAGIGLWHLFTEELDLVNEPVAAALVYGIAQGLTAALGSRIAGSS